MQSDKKRGEVLVTITEIVSRQRIIRRVSGRNSQDVTPALIQFFQVIKNVKSITVNHEPVKSYLLSDRLQFSDSYFKKTMRKLIVAGIVDAIASKEGGFKLARPTDKITLLDVYESIEGDGSLIHSTHLANRIFLNEQSDKPVANVQEVLDVATSDVLTTFSAANQD